jgi:hypothetical protein
VRSVADLEKHIGTESSTQVLVAEKGSLPSQPGVAYFNGTVTLPQPENASGIAAVGEISASRARRHGGFPLSSLAAQRLDALLSSLSVSRHLGDPDSARSRARSRTQALVALHGEHRVLAEMERFARRAGDKPVPPSLLVAVVERSLSSRDHAERLYRGYERDTMTKTNRIAQFVDIVPSKALSLLKPVKGTLVGDSIQVVLPDDPHRTAHLMARLASRGYGLVDLGVASAAISGFASSDAVRSRLPAARSELNELAATLQTRVSTLLAEGVFASGVRDAPVDDKMLSRIAGTGVKEAKPRLEANRVRVTVPSPSIPEASLTFVLELRSVTTVERNGQRRVVAQAVPITVLSPTLIDDDDRTEPIERPVSSARTRFGLTPDPRPAPTLQPRSKLREAAEKEALLNEVISGNELRLFSNLGITIPRTARPAVPKR